MKKSAFFVQTLALLLSACAPTEVPAPMNSPSPPAPATEVRHDKTSFTETPPPTPTEIFTPTPLPAFTQPPTPAPPADAWTEYLYSDAVRFQYPSNWFVYQEDGAITIANFRLEGLLKGHTGEKVKIDILIPPKDISDYPSLTAYLAAQKETNPAENKNILEQIEVAHQVAGYEIVRQTISGLMGNSEATYTQFHIASQGKMVTVVVYGENYENAVRKIVATLVW